MNRNIVSQQEVTSGLDYFGNKYSVGDYIVYATRHGSSMYLQCWPVVKVYERVVRRNESQKDGNGGWKRVEVDRTITLPVVKRTYGDEKKWVWDAKTQTGEFVPCDQKYREFTIESQFARVDAPQNGSEV